MNRTSVFTPEEEQKLWDSGILATDNPTALHFSTSVNVIALEVEKNRESLGPLILNVRQVNWSAIHTLKSLRRFATIESRE